MKLENEWFPIPGYEGFYEIARDGRVRSLTRPVLGRWGKPRVISGVELKPLKGRSGYPQFTLTKDNKPKTITLHRLMALTFLPNPEGYPLVRHLNDDPLDNRVENLAWGTASENSFDSYKNGKRPSYGTHCKHGHEFTPENTYVVPGTKYRHCKICAREAQRRKRK